MHTAEPRDEELLSALLDGDEQAFTALYRRRQAGLFRFALQMSGSAAVAEDVTQEVFLTLIRDGRGYDPRREYPRGARSGSGAARALPGDGGAVRLARNAVRRGCPGAGLRRRHSALALASGA